MYKKIEQSMVGLSICMYDRVLSWKYDAMLYGECLVWSVIVSI